MSTEAELNEKLRENCCIGVVDEVLKCLDNGADINSQNKVNAWTALHWAAKRGHKGVVEVLLKHGANPTICNDKGQLPIDLTDVEDIKCLLSADSSESTMKSEENEEDKKQQTDSSNSGTLSFVPGYLANPVFPYAVATGNPILTNAVTSTAANSATNDSPVLLPGYLANPVLMTATKPVIGTNEKQPTEDAKNDQQVLVPGYIANPVFPCRMATGNPETADDQQKHEFKQIFVPHVQQLGSLVNTYVNSMKSLEKPVEYQMYNSCKTTPVATVFVSAPVNEIVLKIRVADTNDNDFIEIDLNSKLLTYDELINVCCKELKINRSQVSKIRKLPNTVIRRDKDVKRLQPYQELEVILN